MSEGENESAELREVAASEVVPSLAPADVVDPVIECYKKDVDRSLLRENLKLTFEERLLKLQDFTNFLVQLREQNSSRK